MALTTAFPQVMILYMALTDSVLPLLFFFSFILPSHAASSNIFDTPGSVALFLDEGCEKPTTNPTTAELALSTCLVTHGALGISVEHLPHCPSGSYMLQLFKDTTCSNGVNLNQSNGLCFSNGPSGIPAVAWECVGADEAFAATATSTVEARTVLSATTNGGTAPSATVSAPSATNGKNGAPTTTATKSALTSSATGTPSPPGTSSGNGSQTGSGDSNGNGGSSPGLSRNDQIAIGVVLPAGAIVIALLAWLWPKPFKKGKRDRRDKAQGA